MICFRSAGGFKTSIDDATGITDQNGSVQFRTTPPGRARVVFDDVRRLGFELPHDFDPDIEIPPAGEFRVHVVLTRPVEILGQALDELGRPLVGATVVVFPESPDAFDLARAHAMQSTDEAMNAEGWRRAALFTSSRTTKTDRNGRFQVLVDRRRPFQFGCFEDVGRRRYPRRVTVEPEEPDARAPLKLMMGPRLAPIVFSGVTR